MINDEILKTEIAKLVKHIANRQADNGAWHYCFEGTILTDAYTIILIRTLQITNEEPLVTMLTNRIRSKQTENGSWKTFQDEYNGNLSATVESYFALLYSGYVPSTDPAIINAENYIRKNGGLQKTEMLTKIMLSLTNQISWPTLVRNIPIEIILLPKWSPINLYQIVGYARAHWVPIIICSNLNYSIKTSRTPEISHLQRRCDSMEDNRSLNASRSVQNYVINELKNLGELPRLMNKKALKEAENYIIERIEENGTMYSYFSSTFFMIFAFLALGYKHDHPLIMNAFQGIKSLICKPDKYFHIQNSPSTVWDTALLSSAIQVAGVSIQHNMVQKSANYLLTRQHIKYGDWAINNPDTPPGGWGFSDINTFIPDIDDTTAALQAITPLAQTNEIYKDAWQKGVHWVLSMQNKDGGWAAFEKNTDNHFPPFVPFRFEDRVLFDPSTADLTGRTLYFLGSYTTFPHTFEPFHKAKKWLVSHQEKDGSWYGRWGICYIYGTWAAITGLKAIGVPSSHPTIIRAVHWLISIQNEDGGWGESCHSDIKKKYVPLYGSTPTHTAWAIDALTSALETPVSQLEKGVGALLKLLNTEDWRTKYPTGAGIPGSYYIRYRSYNFIWPLRALSHYKSKFR